MNKASILAALGLAALVAGCGGGGSSPAATATPTAHAAAKSGGGQRSDADHNGIPDPITVKGSLGDTLALAGSGLNDDPNDHAKTRIRVTLKDVRGPFKGFDVPAGREVIGVDLHFVNVGGLVYKNAQPQGELIVAGRESGKQTLLIPLSAPNPCDEPSLRLAHGQAKDVCMAFEVPTANRPRTFQYVSDLGYGDRGLWSLR
jgi:hypothetical protein